MDVMQAIANRRSVRRYSGRPIPDEVMARMIEALRLAPSACNYQPWRFILVRHAERRRAVAKACRDQTFVAQAPVVIVGVGLPREAYQHLGGQRDSAQVDVAIALTNLTLAAAAEGLGTCWIGAFDEEALKQILNVPAAATIVALTPLGYPDPAATPAAGAAGRRKAVGDILCQETFA